MNLSGHQPVFSNYQLGDSAVLQVPGGVWCKGATISVYTPQGVLALEPAAPAAFMLWAMVSPVCSCSLGKGSSPGLFAGFSPAFILWAMVSPVCILSLGKGSRVKPGSVCRFLSSRHALGHGEPCVHPQPGKRDKESGLSQSLYANHSPAVVSHPLVYLCWFGAPGSVTFCPAMKQV